MGDIVVIMETSACLMPKLFGSPGTWSSLVSRVFVPDVPWCRCGGSWVPGTCVALPAVSHSCQQCSAGCCWQDTPEAEGQCPL